MLIAGTQQSWPGSLGAMVAVGSSQNTAFCVSSILKHQIIASFAE